jgi:4-amino-4-deoxy-L-arabinose transferase-like glycosyltransferase
MTAVPTDHRRRGRTRELHAGEALAPLPRLDVPWLLGTAVALTALLLAFAARDGYHRDELYFLEASRHLAFGYVDQPPLCVVFAWISRHLFGDSLLGLRLFPALAYGGTVFLTGAIAREVGGRRFAQAFAALCAGAGGYLIIGHLAGPSAYDLLAWTATSLLVVRILRTRDDRLWLAVGVIVGVGLQAKETILLLIGGLAVGFLVTRSWGIVRSPSLWLGVVIAFVLWSPNLVWEATHHWPVVEMDRNLRAEHSGLGYATKYPVLQVLVVNPFLAPVWIAGLIGLWRDERLRPYRAFAIAYLVLLVWLWIVIPDRFYYMAPLYAVLFAAGAVVAEDVIERRRGLFRVAGRRPTVFASRGRAVALALTGLAVLLPLALPVLSPAELGSVQLQNVNYNLGETIGWPQFTAGVARVWRSLPAKERARAVIVTGNYGEAGAIDEFGDRFGLPGAFSGHNSFWWWGPPRPALGTTVLVGENPLALAPYFTSCRQTAVLRNPWGVQNDEEDTPVSVCTGQRAPWARIWPRLKHYG